MVAIQYILYLFQIVRYNSKRRNLSSISFREVCFAGVWSIFVINICIAQAELSVNKSPLLPCPGSPNCVQSTDVNHKSFIAPFVVAIGDSVGVWKQLLQVLNEVDSCRIVVEKTNYIKAQFESKLFKFIDDVEFWLDPNTHQIHVRSASRKGFYDFGVNRRRIERIRQLLYARAESQDGV